MTDTATLVPPPATAREEGDDLDHWICCRSQVGDISVALCGTSVVGPIDDDDEDATCIVCTDLCDNQPEFCPIGGVCPGGVCEEYR